MKNTAGALLHGKLPRNPVVGYVPLFRGTQFSPYKSSSIEEIQQLFTKVFSDSEGQTEDILIGNLTYNIMTGTDAQDLYGFVATENQQIIGSIFFTKLSFQNGVNAFLLSPVAIDTSCQGKGIGQKLINYGIDHLKENAVRIVFTYGDPNFYSKVGFIPIGENIAKAPPHTDIPRRVAWSIIG